MKQGFLDNISNKLNLAATSLLGQLIGVTSSQARQLWEALQAVYASRDPRQATGDAFAAILALTGDSFLPAAPSTADMTITLAAGTYAVGLLKVNVAGDATKVFANKFEIVTAGTTLTDQVFECLTNGPTVANANTLTEITNPVVGFSAPTNPAAADVGRDQETVAAARIRRLFGLARKGSSSVDAVRADLANEDNVPGVDFVSVLENDTDTTDADGLPPHSIRAVVLGGTDADIARTIFASKAGGIATSGGVTVVVTDASGNDHDINFSRPTTVGIKFSGSFDYQEGAYEDDTAAEDALKAALLAAFEEYQAVGRDVIHARYVKAIMALDGAIDIALGVAKLPDSPGTANITIGALELATLDISDISINAIAQAAPP
jgi:hypothetical protein